LALALCVVQQFAWGAQDWNNLRQLRLPDTDDMVRLQQIRDWLGGQSWFDLTQHRLGLGDGLPMHWTRVNDLIPALIITLVKPFAGAHNAELTAVLLGPALLFFAFLLLSARAALSLGGAEATKVAMIIAAFAFPATGMFIPGRIDHHALQIVLLLGAVTAALGGRALLYSGEGLDPEPQSHESGANGPRLRPAPEHRSSATGGMLAGAACALSIVVGLETVPQILALVVIAVVLWILKIEYKSTVPHLLVGIVIILDIGRVLFRSKIENHIYFDNFEQFSIAPFWVIPFALIIRGADETGKESDVWQLLRNFVAIPGFCLAIGTTVYIYSSHGGPYGQVDPFLMRVWMAHVGEAQGLFHQSSIGIVYGYSALVLVALGVAGAAVLRRRPEPLITNTPKFRPAPEHANPKPTIGLRPALEHGRAMLTIDQHTMKYLIIAAPLGMSVLVMLFQLRGAYIGAGLAAPLLATWITQMRARGSAALVASWLLSAGVVHHLLADKLDAVLTRAPSASAPATQASLGKSSGGAGCTDAATMIALNQLPPSRIMGPMDFGAYAIGMTPHHVFAAPYHRNNAGNLAMYRYFMAMPDAAAAQARALKLDYVLICPDSFSELKDEPGLANSLVVALKSGHAPNWLAPVALAGSSAMLFRVGVK
jgi:hypothetical protein